MAVIFLASADADSGDRSGGILRFLLTLTGLDLEPESFAHLQWVARKGAHMTAYAILYGLSWRASGERSRSLGICLVYAISDEWHQSFVSGRVGTPWDVLIDMLGAGLASLVIGRMR